MTLEMNRPKCCCFTGHRENKLKRSEKEILEDLKQAINQAIDDGYTTFITGMAYGVDIWAGELVLKKRFWNRNIKLIAAIPFAGFESRWKDRYHKLKEAKESSTSDYVIANKDGQPLTYTQFKRLWTYITTRTAKPRKARKFVGGKYVKYTIYPVLGEKARNNGKVVYSLDFEVTPHQLRHTYITNLIFASVDPKTVQYLAGHENSKITMDIYAKAKYNRPKDVAPMLEHVFNQWNEATTK